MNQHVFEQGEKSLALARELLDELSHASLEIYALHKAPADDIRSAAGLLCKLACGLGLSKTDLLRLRQVCDNLAWSWRDGADVEQRTACGMRFLVVMIDAMRRAWPRVIEHADAPERPPDAN